MLSMIVTADKNWAISKEHKPLISIPDDVKFVRDTTYGEVIITGRHTFESSFNGRALPNRVTIVVSKDMTYKPAGAIVAHNTKEAYAIAKEYNKNIYVLGGKSIYSDFLSVCNEIHVTSVDFEYDADSYFPNLDKLPEWVMVDESEEQTHFDIVYYFRRYVKRKNYRTIGE